MPDFARADSHNEFNDVVVRPSLSALPLPLIIDLYPVAATITAIITEA